MTDTAADVLIETLMEWDVNAEYACDLNPIDFAGIAEAMWRHGIYD